MVSSSKPASGKKRLTIALTFIVFALSCGKEAPHVTPSPEPSTYVRMHEEAKLIVDSMTIREAVCQTLMIPVPPGASSIGTLFKEVPAGALILFKFNLPEAPERVREFTRRLMDASREASMKIPPLVAVDHEGGTVTRLGKQFVRLPPARSVGAALSLEEMRLLGNSVGRELRAVGLTWILAPIAETATKANEAFLGSRSYHAKPEITGNLVSAYIAGLESAGITTCAKHFPGNDDTDPHQGLPVLEEDVSWYRDSVYPVFRKAIEAGTGSVMLSHALARTLDPETPSSLSPVVIGILKNDLGFRGIALTDDLKMKALSSDATSAKSAIKALAAGADMIMVTGGENLVELSHALETAVREGTLPETRLRDAARRIIETKLASGLRDEWNPERRTEAYRDLLPAQTESKKLLSGVK